MNGFDNMKEITILPADTYTVINKTILDDKDHKIISMLYQPIIGYELDESGKCPINCGQCKDKKKCFVLSKKFFDAIKLNNNNNNKDVGAEEFRVIRENIYKIKDEKYKLEFKKVDEKIANDIQYPINFVILQYRDFHEMLQF